MGAQPSSTRGASRSRGHPGYQGMTWRIQALGDVRSASEPTLPMGKDPFGVRSPRLEPKATDRLSRALRDVRPKLSSVTSPSQLHSWADAAVKHATAEPVPEELVDGRRPEGGTAGDSAGPCSTVAFGSRDGEQALSDALARLQAHGHLRPEADITALGSAFAALLHGGLLLSQATGTPMPLQAAMDMALA